jgi:hypothetical protein
MQKEVSPWALSQKVDRSGVAPDSPWASILTFALKDPPYGSVLDIGLGIAVQTALTQGGDMAIVRRAFYSFHYIPDNWRAAKVREMGVIEGNRPASDNEWEDVKKGGDPAIQRWIDGQLDGKSVAIVLIGSDTAGRKWINYEIAKAWNDHKGVLGVFIHNLEDKDGHQSRKGENPFDVITIGGKTAMSNIVKTYDPPFYGSARVYTHIRDNMADWIERAIQTRQEHE